MVRIAVLLEPFPMRNAVTAHGWIGARLAAMAVAAGGSLAVADLRVICNAPTLLQLATSEPAARPLLIEPPASVQAGFAALLADWHGPGLVTWAAIQAGSAAHEALYEALLRAIRAVYPFDVLAYWGTNQTLRRVAARLDVPMLWAELGPLRAPFPPMLCLDPAGVNGQAGSRADSALIPAAQPCLPGLALTLPVGDGTAYEATLALPEHDSAPHAALLRFVKGSSRVVLLAMQLADDANLLAFGRGWTGAAMVARVLAAQSAPGTVFILRPHPAEAHGYHNHAAGRAVQASVRDRPDVLVFDAAGAAAYLACLSVASEVVCINSSLAFEAALLGKPVRVLGDASYLPPGGACGDLHAPAPMLPDAALRRLIERHYVPEAQFWTLQHWRAAAAAVAGDAGQDDEPRLPTACLRAVGPWQEMADGRLLLRGIGALAVGEPGEGGVDRVQALPEHLLVDGWATDARTGGMVAGVIVACGMDAVWCATVQHRPDVAAARQDAMKLGCGFHVQIDHAALPGWAEQPILVHAVTVDGRAHRLPYPWRWHAGEFAPAALEPA